MNREQLQKVRDALSEGCGWSDQILADYDEKYARHPATEADREFITDSQNKIIEALDILDRALAAPEQEPVAWGMPNAGGLIMDVISPEEHFREEGGYTVPLYRHPAPQSQPIARVTGYYAGRCVIEPLDGKTVFSSGMAVYSAPVAAQEVPPMQWIDVSERVPDEAQIVLFVLRGKVVVGAWIAGIFWYDNAKQVATAWMPLPPRLSLELAAIQSQHPHPASGKG